MAAFVVLGLVGLTCHFSRAQAVQRWTRTYGFTTGCLANDVRQTDDGGYIACGTAGSGSMWLVKTDSLGETLWTRRYKPTGSERCEGSIVLPVGNSGYIMAGSIHIEEDCAPDWMYVLRVDGRGDSLWAGMYQSDSNSSWTRDMAQTNDGGYALSGYRSQPSQWSTRAVLVKIDSLGHRLWDRVYDWTPSALIVANSVQQLPDGGYIMSGENYGSACDAMLLRTDSDGNALWHRCYGGPGLEVFHNAYFVPGSGFVAIGWTDSYGQGFADGWIVKTDTAGRRVGQWTYGGQCRDYCRGWPAADGGYILTGRTNSLGAGGYDVWVLKVDSAANEQWSRTYGGTGDDQALAAHQTADGGYAVAGQIELESGEYAMYLLKTDQGGLAGIDSRPVSRPLGRRAQPELSLRGVAEGLSSFSYYLPESGRTNLVVFDALGRAEASIVSARMTGGWHEASLPRALGRGPHFFRLATAHGCLTSKLVIP
jgi:hypothetical protein